MSTHGFKYLNKKDKFLFGGSILTFVGTFMPWVTADLRIIGISISRNGLHSWGWITFLASAAGILYIGMPLIGLKPLKLPTNDRVRRKIIAFTALGSFLLAFASSTNLFVNIAFGGLVTGIGSLLMTWSLFAK